MKDYYTIRRQLDNIMELPKEHRLQALRKLERECQSVERMCVLNPSANVQDIHKIQGLAGEIKKHMKREA